MSHVTCSAALTLSIASAGSSEPKQASTLRTVSTTNGAVSILLQEFKPLFELIEFYKSTAVRIAKGAGFILMISAMELSVTRCRSIPSFQVAFVVGPSLAPTTGHTSPWTFWAISRNEAFISTVKT